MPLFGQDWTGTLEREKRGKATFVKGAAQQRLGGQRALRGIYGFQIGKNPFNLLVEH